MAPGHHAAGSGHHEPGGRGGPHREREKHRQRVQRYRCRLIPFKLPGGMGAVSHSPRFFIMNETEGDPVEAVN